MSIKVKECMNNINSESNEGIGIRMTGLGEFEDEMRVIAKHIDKIDDFGYCSPFDFDRGEDYLEDAVEKLCKSIRDGSLLSNKRCKVICVTKLSELEKNLAA